MSDDEQQGGGEGGDNGEGRYECASVSGGKFWKIERDGQTVRTYWGKLDSAGQSNSKAFASAEAAKEFVRKTAAKKVKEGYKKIEEERESKKKGRGGGEHDWTAALDGIEDAEGRTINVASIANVLTAADGKSVTFEFKWSDETEDRGVAQLYDGHWFVGPRGPINEAVIKAAVDPMHAQIGEDFPDELEDGGGPDLATVWPELLFFPGMRDECGLVDEYPLVFRFHNEWSDHGLWAGVTEDGSKASAGTFN